MARKKQEQEQPKKKYKVRVTRELCQEFVVEVEAENEEFAETAAEEACDGVRPLNEETTDIKFDVALAKEKVTDITLRVPGHLSDEEMKYIFATATRNRTSQAVRQAFAAVLGRVQGVQVKRELVEQQEAA